MNPRPLSKAQPTQITGTRRLSLAAAASVMACLLACNKAPAPETAATPAPAPPKAEIARLDPALDTIVAASTPVEKISTGYKFLEGPLWRSSGVLWFSDLVGNILYQWSPDGKVTQILNPGGYDGNSLPAGGYIGPNGEVQGPNNTVILCQHGNRRIVSISPDMKVKVLIDKFEGKKLNSPNDVVYAADGALYFTDPPFGLPKADDDPAKELKFNGVFRFAKGKLEAVVKDVPEPNGIAFSPDGKILYLSNSEADHRNWRRCDVAANGSVSNCSVFAEVGSSPESGLPDGMKVDSAGNVYGAGPGGVWIFSPEGKHIGTVKLPETPSNCAWGDDGKSLYITAVTSVYRVKLNIAGEKALYN